MRNGSTKVSDVTPWLSPDRDKLLEGYLREERTYKAIAKLMGTTRSAVAGHIWRQRNPDAYVKRGRDEWDESRLTESWAERKARRAQQANQQASLAIHSPE